MVAGSQILEDRYQAEAIEVAVRDAESEASKVACVVQEQELFYKSRPLSAGGCTDNSLYVGYDSLSVWATVKQ